MKINTCPHCGEIVQEEAWICIKCGKPITAPAMPSDLKRPLVVTLIAIFLLAESTIAIVASVVTVKNLVASYSSLGIGWLAWVGTAIIIGMALGELIIGLGLWQLKNWARRLAIVFQLLGVFSNIQKLGNAFKLSGSYGGLYNKATPDYLYVLLLLAVMLVQGYIIYWLSQHRQVFR